MDTATLFTSGRSLRRSSPAGATSAATFSVAVAAARMLFFVTSDKRQRRCFLAEKAAALQRCFLSKFSAAAATANKLPPRLSIHIFTRYSLESLLSACFHSALVTSLFQFSRTHTRPL